MSYFKLLNWRFAVQLFLCLLISAVLLNVLRSCFMQKVPIKVSVVFQSNNDCDMQLYYTKSDKYDFSELWSIRKNHTGDKSFRLLEFTLPVKRLSRLKLAINSKYGGARLKGITIFSNDKKTITPQHLIKYNTENIGDKKIVDNSLSFITGGGKSLFIFSKADSKCKMNRVYDYYLVISIFILSFFLSYKLLSYYCFKLQATNLGYGPTGFIVIVITLILFPAFKINFNDVDKNENRTLALFPNLFKERRLNIAFGEEIEAWFADRFYQRRKCIDLYSQFQNKLNGRLENDKAMEGLEDWLFYKGDGSIARFQNKNRYTERELSLVSQVLIRRTSSLKQLGISYYTFVAPDKNKVYGEYYPPHIKKKNSVGRGKQLHDLALKEESGFNFIYPYNALLKDKKETRELSYYKTDTHWNSYGAYIGYCELMKSICKDHSDLQYVTSDKLSEKRVEYLEGDLVKMLGLEKSAYSDVKYPALYLKSSDFIFLKNNGVNGVRTSSEKPLKVVVFRDSFTGAMLPFISETFGDVQYVWSHDFDNYQDFIEDEKPDIVIHEMVERFMDSLTPKKAKID